MRNMVVLFILLIPITAFANDITFFEPLKSEENLAFGIRYDDHERINILTLYVVSDNDLQNITEIGTWRNVPLSQGVHFTNDFKMCFFTVIKPIDRYFSSFDIFWANGYTGEIGLLTNIPASPFRISSDGRYLVFIDPFTNFFTANIYIFDVVERKITNKVEWTTNHRVDAGWRIHRSENVFYIYGMQGISIVAYAIFDVQTAELSVEWDMTNVNTDFLPSITDPNWQDDIVFYESNPNIKLY